MKKVFLALLGFLFITAVSNAQDDGAKMAKSAGKAYAAYNIDPAGNASKLTEAKTKIDQALQTPEAQALASAWITKGDIYSTFIIRDMTMRGLNPNAPLTGDNDALVAFEAYKMAYDKPDAKKYEKSDAVKGIVSIQGYLINIGIAKYEAKEYDKAFRSFKASLDAHDILKANKEKSALDDPKQYDEQVFFTGVIAGLAKRCNDAVVYYDMLYKKGTDNVSVYEGLYNCKTEMKDSTGAMQVLQEGRKKFPDDSALLFAEINLYLASGRLDELTGRLEQAIKQEPNNVGLYVTLGNVYDNLYQAMSKKNDKAKANEYFDLAKTAYTTAIGKEPKNGDANYSLGALYYNQAAVRTQEMNAMPDDFSAAGLKKSKAVRDEIIALFDQALPYFQKSESVNPNDVNTLVALSEIYARKEDEVMNAEFKKRILVIRDGGKNAAPYFKM